MKIRLFLIIFGIILFSSSFSQDKAEYDALMKKAKKYLATYTINIDRVDIPPVAPGCDTALSPFELENCFTKFVQNHVLSNFRFSVLENQKFKNKKGIAFTCFEIDTKGTITKIKIICKNKNIKKELYRVARLLPSVNLGYYAGAPTKMKFVIPMTFPQNKYIGKFSRNKTLTNCIDKVPVGHHEAIDTKNKINYEIEYNNTGLIQRIKIVHLDDSIVKVFPKKISKIKWLEIKPGLWINNDSSFQRYKLNFYKTKMAKVHCSGYLLSGEPFVNTFVTNDPIEGELFNFNKGFSLGIENIKPGDIRIVKVSPELAYGSREGFPVPPNTTIIYFIYVIE